jgi:hypothetical protein
MNAQSRQKQQVVALLKSFAAGSLSLPQARSGHLGERGLDHEGEHDAGGTHVAVLSTGQKLPVSRIQSRLLASAF